MIDQVTLQAATTKLLLDSMSAEDREKLLTAALTSVLTPKRSGSYPYNESSPLQDAFNHAARLAAGAMIKEYFERPEVKERVHAAVAEAIEGGLTGGFIEKLTERMVNGIWSER